MGEGCRFRFGRMQVLDVRVGVQTQILDVVSGFSRVWEGIAGSGSDACRCWMKKKPEKNNVRSVLANIQRKQS